MSGEEKFPIEKVLQALRECGGNRQMTLAKLKCSPATLQNKIKLAKAAGLKVPHVKKGRHKTMNQIEKRQQNIGLAARPPVIPDNFDDLPDAPLYDKEPTIDNRGETSGAPIDPELIRKAGNTYGRRLDIHIASGNWDAAKSVIDEARRDAMGDDAVTPLLEVPLVEIGIPVRECNALEEYLNVIRVGDLAKVLHERLVQVPNFGNKSIDILFWSVLKLAAIRDADREAAQIELKERKRSA